MKDPKAVLQQYWGYPDFRPLQEDIVRSALAGNDTLALMPTGGGKSICFQVPALCMEGLCIVVSPLIALMGDQVQNLQQRGVKALYLHSGMKYSEIDTALDNCIYGDYKFLYVSPERLQSELFQARLPKMNICLVAVDESHCISQWGYDFRPPYLQVADVVEKIEKRPPILAVTATATPRVADDIEEKLRFRKQSNRFQMSFKRENLGYVVVETSNKHTKLLQILKKIPGSSVVYLRSRNGCAQLANFLTQHGISADYYHAGLAPEQRTQKQESWTLGKTRVIVATNAFGMGIDKPDVRSVVHMDLPDSLEAYFQEAGRGGRDGDTAWAVLLTNRAEAMVMVERNLSAFPNLEEVRKVYQALGNYLMLANGSGEGQEYIIDIQTFCSKYTFQIPKTLQALKILERQDYINLTEDLWSPSQLHLKADHATVYQLQFRNQKWENLMGTLLRSYGGLNSQYVKIDEQVIAKRSKLTFGEVVDMLKELDKSNYAVYQPKKQGSSIRYTRAKQEARYLRIEDAFLKDRYEDLKFRVTQMAQYVTNSTLCRSIALVQYFGEKHPTRCGKCDVCKRENKGNTTTIENEALALLQQHSFSVEELVDALDNGNPKMTIEWIRQALDSGRIRQTTDGKLKQN